MIPRAALTYQYCNGAIKETYRAANLYRSDEMSAPMGGWILFGYKSRPLLTAITSEPFSVLLRPMPEQRASYRYVDTSGQPDYRRAPSEDATRPTSISLGGSRATDFLFKSSCHRSGISVTGQDGKIKIKCEKPQLTQYLQAATSAGIQ